jgi:hypothetical protein
MYETIRRFQNRTIRTSAFGAHGNVFNVFMEVGTSVHIKTIKQSNELSIPFTPENIYAGSSMDDESHYHSITQLRKIRDSNPSSMVDQAVKTSEL